MNVMACISVVYMTAKKGNNNKILVENSLQEL